MTALAPQLNGKPVNTGVYLDGSASAVAVRGFQELGALAENNKAERALALWLGSYRSENTRRAYRKEIEAFAAHAGAPDTLSAVSLLLSLPDGEAHQWASAWKAEKIRKGLSPASINRSMAALNSFVVSARMHGLTQLRLAAKGIKSKPYRDTRGPGTDGIQNLLAAAHNQDPRKAARDVAILRLGYGLGLRRGEIVSLNIEHVDLEAGAVLIMGKGRAELEPLTLPANTKAALEAWLAVRGTDDPDVPRFVNVSRAHHGERMTGAGVYHVIRYYLGTKAGVKARPHGLRHTAITKALDVFSGDYRKARAFSRHASLDTVRLYDDNRADHAGQVAQAIDALIEG